MTIRIRPARPADARAIAEAHTDAWRSAYREILPPSYLAALSPLERESLWSTVIAGSSAVLLVADESDEVVGFVCAGAARDREVDRTIVGEISAIYLREHAWRRRAGRALFESACDALRQRGFREMILWVLEPNARARAFYERMGMTLESGPEMYFTADGETFREVRYRLTL